MLDHVFPEIILINEGLLPSHSSIETPRSKRTTIYIAHNEEHFLPMSDRSGRESAYLRHVQSELNLHRLKHEIDSHIASIQESTLVSPIHRRVRSRPSAKSMRKSFIADEPMPVHSLPNVDTTPAPRTLCESQKQEVKISGDLAHNSQRYSLLPVITYAPIQDALRAHQYKHWRAVTAAPVQIQEEAFLRDIPEGVIPKWPEGRFYARVRRASVADREGSRRSKIRPRFGNVLEKIKYFFRRR